MKSSASSVVLRAGGMTVRPGGFIPLWCLSAILGLGACAAQNSSITLVIDAESGVRARASRLDLDVRGAEGTAVFSENYDLLARGFPIRNDFVPRGGDLSRFILATVSAYEPGSSTPLVVSRVRSGFTEGRTEVLVMLVDGCIGQICPDGETCVVESGQPGCAEVTEPSDAGASNDSAVTDGGIDGPASDGAFLTDGASGDGAMCIPDCQGRTCGADSRCAVSCGSCTSPQTCSASGRCESVTLNGPRFIDPPTIAETQPIPARSAFVISMTATDPQGIDTIVQAEVRNPSGAAGTAGRFAVLVRREGTGEYNANVPWSAFSASNGGLPEDVSGTTTRVLRVRIVDQDGNELLQDVSVQLGRCTEALCAGQCADCPTNENGRSCMGTSCIASSCEPPYLACAGACALCPSMSISTTCDGAECVATDCAAGYHVCSGQCVSNASVNSCGPTSCTACQPPSNATSTCDGTSCGFACIPGRSLLCGGRCAPCPSDGTTFQCAGDRCDATACRAGSFACGGFCLSETYPRYLDNDGDGYGAGPGVTNGCPTNRYVSRDGDCNDSDANVFPGQTDYFEVGYATPSGGTSFDYNCDGQQQQAGGVYREGCDMCTNYIGGSDCFLRMPVGSFCRTECGQVGYPLPSCVWPANGMCGENWQGPTRRQACR